MRKAIIVDIDGTIANIDHRLHHILKTNKEPDYDKFYESLDIDLPKRDVIELVECLRHKYWIILVTGRLENYREQTKEWLKEQNVYFDKLYMRADGDFRSDDIIKLEIYNKHIKPKHDVLCVLEDRQRVVDMWRRIGLTCLQVAQWDERKFSVKEDVKKLYEDEDIIELEIGGK